MKRREPELRLEPVRHIEGHRGGHHHDGMQENHHQARSGAGAMEEQDKQVKRRRVTTITTVTTIVTEDVAGEGEEAEVVRSETVSSDQRQRLLKQLQALQDQLLEEECREHHHHHPRHHHGEAHHPLHHHPHHDIHDQSDHSLTQRPPFSATPTRPFPTRIAEPTKHAEKSKPEVMEKGHIYFLYRPKVGAQEAHSFDDVARMYILLKTFPADGMEGCPSEEESSAQSFYRLIRIGKKKLPSIREHNRFWGVIEEATTDYEKIHHLIVSEHYTTLTLGERIAPACRPAGEGVYAIVKRDEYTHLAYVLELPHELGEVQKALNIGAEGCYVLSVKNPQALPYVTYSATVPPKPVPSAATDHGIPLPVPDDRRAVQQMIQDQPGLPRVNPSNVPQSTLQVEFPPHVQEAFKGRRFAPALPLEMLDRKGVEVVIIGESDNLVAEFGKLGQELEGETIYAQNFTDEDLFKELHITKSENPIAPLRYGTWA